MSTDLTKMVEQYQGCHDPALYRILLAIAAEIEKLKEEIDKLKWINDPGNERSE